MVFTTGSFDLLNPGHCRYLAEAKTHGDILVVGVSTNFSDAKLKGSEYPLVGEDIRAELLTYLKTVDYVTIVDEDRPHAVLSLLQPDVYFTNESDWENGIHEFQEEYLVKRYGGKVIRREKSEPYFTVRALVDHIANIRVLQMLESYLKDKLGDFKLDPSTHLRPADFGQQIPHGKGAFNSNELIVPFQNLPALREALHKENKKIVFVSGSYDLLHIGHARFIEQAGLQGDILVVGIPSDKSLRELKGIGRPVISQNSRAYVLGHLDPVDHVMIFDESTVFATLEQLKPDIFFTVDEEWNKGYKESREYKLVTSYGGDVVRVERQAPMLSASAIIDKISLKKVKEIFSECMDEERYAKILKEKSRI